MRVFDNGWYIPKDKNAGIILETKRPSEEVTNQKHINQLLTNCAVLATTHRNVIGILYNGKETNIFINGDHIPELSGKPLEHKSFYLNYIKDQTLDKNAIYAITQRIKNPRNQGVSRFQSGEELVNSVGK